MDGLIPLDSDLRSKKLTFSPASVCQERMYGAPYFPMETGIMSQSILRDVSPPDLADVRDGIHVAAVDERGWGCHKVMEVRKVTHMRLREMFGVGWKNIEYLSMMNVKHRRGVSRIRSTDVNGTGHNLLPGKWR